MYFLPLDCSPSSDEIIGPLHLDFKLVFSNHFDLVTLNTYQLNLIRCDNDPRSLLSVCGRDHFNCVGNINCRHRSVEGVVCWRNSCAGELEGGGEQSLEDSDGLRGLW